MTKVFDVNNATVTALALPQGAMINGRIVPSVATNNLTVAIKGLDGNDPSATNPVYVRIGNTIRSITAALSVTKNAATNWCNAGSAELATKEIDYFVYLIWNTTPATDIMDIGFSRIPHGRVYSDFSGTSTNEKYLASGNASAPTATDDLVVIGRFAATLSAGAGYTWTVPTYTNSNLIQHPIYETRWLGWAPQYSGTASMTFTSVTTNLAEYKIKLQELLSNLDFLGTTGGTASTTLQATLPFTNVNASLSPSMACWVKDGAGALLGYGFLNPSGANFRKNDSSNYGLGAGRGGNTSGIIYRI